MIILLNSKLLLKKREALHLHEQVSLFEERPRSRAKSQRVGMSVRVTKGIRLYYSLGDGVIKGEEGTIEKIDDGELYLTSKRLVFIGSKKTLNIPLKKIFCS